MLAWRALAVMGAALFCLALSACGDRDKPWSLYNVRGHLPDLQFTLKAAGDKTVTANDLKGKTVLLFFGYTNCPDICPTTMAQLSDVLARLGDDAANVRILFVSVDPHRDTPDKLQAYVDAFNNKAIGLTGTESQIADVARRYRVSYVIAKPQPGAAADEYDVTHSRGVYIFDNQGRARLLASDADSTDKIVQDLRRLVSAANDQG
jgi:protein SCO1/2